MIALAAGEARHILQLVAINPEKWTWNKSSLIVGALQSKFHGSWHSDGSPLSKIQFATKLKQYDNTRWLVAQKETSTTIFEPELKARPVVDAESTLGSASGAANHIAMNAVVTLTTDATGGEAHCDFSLNMGLEEETPQLAVIDRSGTWSVWYITRAGRGRTRTTTPVLVKKGGWGLPLHVLPWNEADPPDSNFRIAWTSRSSRADEWDRDSDPSEDSGLVSRAPVSSYFAGVDSKHPRYDGLLVCSNTQLQILDNRGNKPPSRLDFARRDGRDTLLDALAFPSLASHVFVLTTERLYLLDATLAEGQEDKPPNILLSCRHFRNDHQESLKILVTKLPSVRDQVCSLVLLFSTRSFRVDLFWFTVAQEDGMARFHYQTVQLPGLKVNDSEGPRGIQSLAAVPLQLSDPKGKGRSEARSPMAAEPVLDEVQFYQLFGLATDLGLSSSIVAITRGTSRRVNEPTRAARSTWDQLRRARFLRNRFLLEADQAFVVPDGAEPCQRLSVVHKSIAPERYEVIQLRSYLLKLMQEINRGLLGQVSDDAAGTDASGRFLSVGELLSSREQDDHISLRPLLGFANLWQPLDIARAEDEWGLDLTRLARSQVQLFACGTYGPTLSVMDFFEKLSVNWSARLPADSLKATQWRYMEMALEKMAAEVYLSQQGIYATPQSTLDLASKSIPKKVEDDITNEDLWNELPPLSSQPRSSQVLPTPSATPASSRATSEAVDGIKNDVEEEGPEQEDPAVTRLRMYLPSIKFTPPAKDGPTRLLSLWPEQRGVDPTEYNYRPWGRPDGRTEEAKRRREREEERRRRKEEKKARLGIKTEGAGSSFSQPGMIRSSQPGMVRSSPPPQTTRSSQVHSQPFGFGLSSQIQSQSQSQGFSQGFGFSQIMSQPLPGEFGGRPSRPKKKAKSAKPALPGFK